VLAEKARYRQKSDLNDYNRVTQHEMRPDQATESVVVSEEEYIALSTREKSSTVSAADCQLDPAGLVRMAAKQVPIEAEKRNDEFEAQFGILIVKRCWQG